MGTGVGVMQIACKEAEATVITIITGSTARYSTGLKIVHFIPPLPPESCRKRSFTCS